MISRLNLFEKKITLQDEKLGKLAKDQDNFKKDIESKLKEQFKSFEWSIEKFNKQS